MLLGKRRENLSRVAREEILFNEVIKMETTNPIIECLGRFSKTNLAIMIFDDVRGISSDIWQIAERINRRGVRTYQYK